MELLRFARLANICLLLRASSSGENISSLMVEQELSSHAHVLECCVVARAHKKWGERGHATVVLKLKAPKKSGEEWEKELKAHCKTKMSGFAVPEWIEIVEELPKTSTGSEYNEQRDERGRNRAKQN